MENKLTLTGTTFILIETDPELAQLQKDGPKLKWAIDDFDHQFLRNRLKHTKLTKREYDLVETIRGELMDCLRGAGVI